MSDFIDTLRKCEPSCSIIAKDAGVARQAVYLWKNDHIPSLETFNKLAENDKYKDALAALDYEVLRSMRPMGRPWPSCK